MQSAASTALAPGPVPVPLMPPHQSARPCREPRSRPKLPQLQHSFQCPQALMFQLSSLAAWR